MFNVPIKQIEYIRHKIVPVPFCQTALDHGELFEVVLKMNLLSIFIELTLEYLVLNMAASKVSRCGESHPPHFRHVR